MRKTLILRCKTALLLLALPLVACTQSSSPSDILPKNKMCIQDVKRCPDGHYVGRSGIFCRFDCSKSPPTTEKSPVLPTQTTTNIIAPEESEELMTCAQDTKECPNGEVALRSGPHCEFICPQTSDASPPACTRDAKQCPDGSIIGRSGPHCEFICPPSSPN